MVKRSSCDIFHGTSIRSIREMCNIIGCISPDKKSFIINPSPKVLVIISQGGVLAQKLIKIRKSASQLASEFYKASETRKKIIEKKAKDILSELQKIIYAVPSKKSP